MAECESLCPMVIKFLIALLVLKSLFSSRTNALSDKCWRVSCWKFAMVSRIFFLADYLFLNTLEVEW